MNRQSARAKSAVTCAALIAAGLLLAAGLRALPRPSPGSPSGRKLTDATGREVFVPDSVDRVICSGSGCLRLLTYLGGQDLAVAVDDAETRLRTFDARPYALANPRFRSMPMFGEFRGHDNPERIIALAPQPQVIFKTYPESGHDPAQLQRKTGIPVVVLDYGDLGDNREAFYRSLRLMAEVIGRQERADKVVAFFEEHIRELDERTSDIPAEDRPSAYIGGVAYRGAHGYRSTEPTYPPFRFVNARNVVHDGRRLDNLRHSTVAKEMIVEWDPDYLFLDLSTLQLGSASGLHELKADPVYATLTAVKEGRVYGLMPYNWYTTNYGSLLANAYFIGKVLYPDRFADIDPKARADEIYRFLVGAAVFDQMNEPFGGLGFAPLPVGR